MPRTRRGQPGSEARLQQPILGASTHDEAVSGERRLHTSPRAGCTREAAQQVTAVHVKQADEVLRYGREGGRTQWLLTAPTARVHHAPSAP